MSFDPKNKTHKASLYRALVAAAELTNERFDEFLQTPFNPPWSLAENYRRNLQRGDYSAIRAKALYDFLLNHHFDVAHLEAPDIFLHTPAMRWRKMLDDRVALGTLKIVPMASRFGLVQRDSQSASVDITLKLGQRFCLELSSETDGYAIILQGLGDLWYPVTLDDNGTYETTLEAGITILPQYPDGAPDPLYEETHEGPHSFVVVTATTSGIPLTIDQLITWVCDHDAQLHRAIAQIVR